MTRFTREAIGLRPAKGRTPLDGRNVRGIALHWPAIAKPIHGAAAVQSALRGWQDYHMDGHGWSDIAYQEAIDQDGNSYLLRGLATRSAANGDEDVNSVYGALLLVLAPGERPSKAMHLTVQRRINRHAELFHLSTKVVGHQDVRPEPTSCPGPVVMAAIRAGAWRIKRGKGGVVL